MTASLDDLCWPKAYPDFEELDSLLRCGICHDYISTALMTPCSHNFCSMCIRKHMLYKTNCPTCSADTVESQLKCNRTLDNIVLIIVNKLKKTLCKALKENIPSNSQSAQTSSSSVSQTDQFTSLDHPKVTGNQVSRSSALVHSPKVHPTTSNSFVTALNSSFAEPSCVTPSHQKQTSTVSSPNLFTKSPMKSPTFAGKSDATQKIGPRTVAQMFTSPVKKANLSTKDWLISPLKKTESSTSEVHMVINQEKKAGTSSVSGAQMSSNLSIKPGSSTKSVPSSPYNSSAASSTAIPSAEERVACPVCNVDILQRYINVHLDRCLKNISEQSQEKKPEKTSNSRRPLPKVVYHMMNERKLREKLAELKLSTQGDRKTLEKRHQRYTLLYNCECDKEEPRPVSELIKQLDKEEKEESRAACRTLTTLQVDRKSDAKVIEQVHKQYEKDHKTSFDSLIADLQRRKAQKQSATSTAGPSTSTSVSHTESTADIRNTPQSSHSKQQKTIHKPDSSMDKDKNPSMDTSSPSLLLGSQLNEPQSVSPLIPQIEDSSPFSSPGISYSPVTPDQMKSPVLGKRRLFETKEPSPVIIISDDDSNCTVFSEGDMAEIDALTQHNLNTTQEIESEVPVSEVPESEVSETEFPLKKIKRKHALQFISEDDSSDSDGMFEAPKKKKLLVKPKTPEVKPETEVKKRVKKQYVPKDQEPRRSSRKKTSC